MLKTFKISAFTDTVINRAAHRLTAVPVQLNLNQFDSQFWLESGYTIPPPRCAKIYDGRGSA